MAIPTRGLNNIQTLAGRVDQLSLPYRAYMQITCLEMEKARRQSERRSASARVAQIDARLKQMEIEKVKLIQAIDRSPTERGGSLPKMKLQEPVKRLGGFKIRY
jgi:ppGpp synthetase/RelA/SpoT-type nucleotidyltranferase